MAGTKFIERIQKSARFLATPTAQSARGYLDAPLETALKVIDCFADGKPHDYEEISEMSGIHQNTVRQIIRALEIGGYPLQFTYAAMKATTGRKPVAIKKRARK
jgi:uncharacterized protein YerC